MTKSKLPKSIRKFLRKEKAKIRKEIADFYQQQKLIAELYNKFLRQNEGKRDL